MFGIGAVLQAEDFKRILQKPIIVLIGCCAQFSIMPLGAFLLTKVFGFPPEISVGLILTGSAPGAMASNVMSYIAKADTAYSVSLTTLFGLVNYCLYAVMSVIDPRSDFLAGKVAIGRPFPQYGPGRHLYGDTAAVCGIRRKALLQRKITEGFADFPRYIRDLYYIYMLTGNSPQQGLFGRRHGLGPRCRHNIECVWNVGRLWHRVDFSYAAQKKANPGN
jgi:hypothetical protein